MVTPSPTSCTTPARSLPSPEGKVAGNLSAQPSLANGRLTGIDPGCFDPDHDFTGRGVGDLDFRDVEDVPSAVVVEPHCLGHRNSFLGNRAITGCQMQRALCTVPVS